MAKNILVIDDDVELVQAVTTFLEAAGYGVSSASDGSEGFAKAVSGKPDLILLDVMMAHQTEGFDVCRNFSTDAKTRDIPVVLVTGIKKEMNLPFGFEPDSEWLPVKVVLEKPVKPDVLLKTIEGILGK